MSKGTKQRIVIVGASLAGAKAAEALRNEGFIGSITLIGAESQIPYARPPLSKDYLRGETGFDKAAVFKEEFYRKHSVDLRMDTTVTELHPQDAKVSLSTGESLAYDKLLLATGSQVRRLDVPGADLEGMHYLRTVSDSDALRERIKQGGKLVVVGAGWIGMEVAASANQMGAEVTVVKRPGAPFEKILGKEIGDIYQKVHQEHGVTFVDGVVESIEGEGSVRGVKLADGKTLPADFILVGIGVTPDTALAEQAGLDVNNGVIVNEFLQSSASNIYAAGDIANAHHPFFNARIRIEHWANAQNQGYAAGKNMAGNQEAYERLPYFYSDQYDVGMEYSGYAPVWDEVVFRGDTDKREFIAFWLKDGKAVAGMNVNIWDVIEDIQALVKSRKEINQAKLTDPDVPLKKLLS